MDILLKLLLTIATWAVVLFCGIGIGFSIGYAVYKDSYDSFKDFLIDTLTENKYEWVCVKDKWKRRKKK